jgi:hypothetical protein
MNVSAQLMVQALELMKDAEIRGDKGPEKLKFVQDCLKAFVREQDWTPETKSQALNFVNDVLPGAIEMAVKFSKLKFVQTVASSCWCF